MSSHVAQAISAIPRERRMRLAATLANCDEPLLRALALDMHAATAREDAEFAEIAEAFAAEQRRETRKREAQIPPPPPYVKETD